MTLVVDASVLVEAVGGAAGSKAANDCRHALRASAPLVTTSFADIECLSAWRRQMFLGALETHEFSLLALALQRAPLTRVDCWALSDRIVELSPNLTPYDASYVALAEAVSAPLLTLDRRLASAPGLRCQVIVPGDTSARRSSGAQ